MPEAHRRKAIAMKTYQSMKRNALFSVLGILLGLGVANAQPGTGPFAAFPTQNIKDGRFLGIACAGLSTLEQNVTMILSAPAGTSTFNLDIFDGDTGGLDGADKSHWDLGSRQLKFSLYADPLRSGDTSSTELIGEWRGNEPNPTSGTLWTSSAAAMPDNAWWALTVNVAPNAQAPSGNYFYTLVIETDGACSAGEQLESSLKIATSDSVRFSVTHFALVAGLRQLADDLPIIYPGSTMTAPVTGSFLTAPTTYDGTFELYFSVPLGETELRLFDGDFDFGTNSAIGLPSGVSLDACADQDDPDSAADYAGFPFSTLGANPEGVQSSGMPPDDNQYDAFRRGEPGDPNRVGCVRYEVIDPEGHIYRNDNPSGSYEWEQFLIASLTSPSIGDADWVSSEDTLPSGVWKVKIVGLDLANLSLWHGNTCATRPTRDPEPGEDPDEVPRTAACPDESVLLLGDFVWEDTASLGNRDSNEAGIAGVVVELVRSSDGVVIATAVTGDSTSRNWAACAANHSGSDSKGLYCFGVDSPGKYEIRIAAGNFESGQSLSGKVSTTGGESSTVSPAEGNSMNARFGYRNLGISPSAGR
ncbi:MAG TPA: SdrD B-like domain-containing protein [Thermoanaerobaculia bacterium]|jgi:hypothetical protein|nr:SdrD B-like domain-containing protein [Thermoanaerobaculia bacterium]